jgi:acetyltransferase-like isoleucine patch superfamily enzyme
MQIVEYQRPIFAIFKLHDFFIILLEDNQVSNFFDAVRYSLLHRIYLPVHYRFCFYLLRLILGDNALSVLVERAWFPVDALRALGGKIGGGVRIHRGLYLHEARNSLNNLEIGDSVFLGARLMIDLSDKVIIESRAAVGMNVTIITHANFGDSERSFDNPAASAPVKICSDAVVNWGTILNKGTVVSVGCIILPGSVVAGTLLEGATYVGNPGRPLPKIRL